MTTSTVIILPSIDYTSRDQSSIFEDMKDKIPYYTPDWTDQNETDPGIWLLRIFSGALDISHWYLDAMVNNCFLPTTFVRSMAINLLRLIDYSPDTAISSTVDLTFTLSTTYGLDVIVPAGTQCQTIPQGSEEPVIFETVESLTIAAGQTVGTVGAEQGESVTEDLGISDGSKYQDIILETSNIIGTSIQFFVDLGAGFEEWTLVDSFIGYAATDKIYTLETTSDNFIRISLGDNAQGLVPVVNSDFQVTYKIGGGANTNVGANTIQDINDVIYSGGNPVSINVNNAASATGGADEESIDDMKRKGPRSLRTRFGLVAAEDYEAAAEEVAGVKHAHAIGTGYRTVTVYIMPNGGGLPSLALKAAVKAALEARAIVTTEIIPADPTYVSVNSTGVVYVLANYKNVDIEDATGLALTNLFDPNLRTFGEAVNFSDFDSTIDNTIGVDHVDINQLTMTPVVVNVLWSSVSTFGSYIINALTGYETWTVEMTSSTTFKVTGGNAGLQTATGIVGVAYLVDDGSFGFTLTLTSGTPVVGDRSTIRTSPLRNNVVLLENEIAQIGTTTFSYTGGA